MAAGISEPGDAGGREEQMESHGQEGQVSHQLEALLVQDSPVQQVGEAQPLQGQAHRAETGVPQLHVQEIVIQTLEAGAGLETAGGWADGPVGARGWDFEHPSELRSSTTQQRKGPGSPPWLLYLGELLLLPRGDGEVQDVVEALGGHIEASRPPEVRQVLVTHQELGWQSGVHSYPVPGGSPKGRAQGALALNGPARNIWTLANRTKGNTDDKLLGTKESGQRASGHTNKPKQSRVCCRANQLSRTFQVSPPQILQAGQGVP